MSDYIIKAENIGKRYIIDGAERESYVSLRDSIVRSAKNLIHRDNTKRSADTEEFWAVKDLSFSIEPGDRVGIVGHNGAGKSTLLKLLSRITEPTTGAIYLRGRIASLLEVGTGFHPELTGRENIFLNGAVLGMRRPEIRRKFDEIVAFSGVERFLNTPVKRYSSGMYVRLAFSVAAHLESEIMVIDEVLAVGDAEFQKKCLGKMEDVSKSGRTILFVSHNMGAVETLCNKGIFMSRGQKVMEGSSREVIRAYQEHSLASMALQQGVVHGTARGKLIRKIEILSDGMLSDVIPMGGSMEVRVHFEAPEPLQAPVLGVVIKDHFSLPLLGINNKNYSPDALPGNVRQGVISMVIPYLQLMSGNYMLDLHLGDGHLDVDVWRDACAIKVEQKRFADGEFPNESLNKFFIPEVHWHLKRTSPIS